MGSEFPAKAQRSCLLFAAASPCPFTQSVSRLWCLEHKLQNCFWGTLNLETFLKVFPILLKKDEFRSDLLYNCTKP